MNKTGNEKDILTRRAQKLARVDETRETGDTMELVEFLLADERYAVQCRFVREVYPLRDLTPVPGTPSFILGIVSVRGEVFSVVDLKKFFELPARGLTDLTRVIILHQQPGEGDMEFGILAEEVTGTLSLPVQDIQPPLPTMTGARADYLAGVAKNRLIILDAAKLLADKKMIVHQEVDI